MKIKWNYIKMIFNVRTIFSLFKKQCFSHFIIFENGIYPIINHPVMMLLSLQLHILANLHLSINDSLLVSAGICISDINHSWMGVQIGSWNPSKITLLGRTEVKMYSLLIKTIDNQDCLAIKNQRRQWYPTPVLLPGKSLVGCSPWGC